MSEAAKYIIGAAVHCQDAECGELRRILLDPPTRSITHLVVEPRHRRNGGRLVPITQVEATSAEDVRLGCTAAEFDGFEPAEEVEVRTEARIDWESQHARAGGMRGFGPLGLGLPRGVDGLGRGTGASAGVRMESQGVLEHNIPEDEGEVGRGQPVHASDGPIGHVHGVVADPQGHQVTHVLLCKGHLWGEKEVAIPASAVKMIVDDGVYLTLTKKEVGELPPLTAGRPG